MTSYPSTPGFKVRGFPDPSPSQDAAIAMVAVAPALRARILRYMQQCPGRTWTPDEMASRLATTILNTRPRFTEMRGQGRIERTGERRPSFTGKGQWVYRLAATSRARGEGKVTP